MRIVRNGEMLTREWLIGMLVLHHTACDQAMAGRQRLTASLGGIRRSHDLRILVTSLTGVMFNIYGGAFTTRERNW